MVATTNAIRRKEKTKRLGKKARYDSRKQPTKKVAIRYDARWTKKI